MNRALILDRDGTLNEDTMYPHKIEDFKLLPGVIEGMKKLSKSYDFFIITNQSGIGRGIFNEEDFHKFNNHLISILSQHGIQIKKTYFCPHAPDENCGCRKPSIKFIKEIEKKYAINLKESWLIGDHPHDVEMGLKAGCKTIFMLTGHGKNHFNELEKNSIKPDFVAENFMKAAEFIMKNKDG